jgi:hypothetical protein
VAEKARAALATVVRPSHSHGAWSFEALSTTQKGVGAGERIFSGKSLDYNTYLLDGITGSVDAIDDDQHDMWTTLNELEAEHESGMELVVPLHGSGTTNPSKLLWKTMNILNERSKAPLKMTYRAVGSGTGQYEFIGENNGLKPYQHFGAGDIPMGLDDYNLINGQMIHVPFVGGFSTVDI